MYLFCFRNSAGCAILSSFEFIFIPGGGGGILLPPPHTRAIFFLFVANGPTHTTAPYKKALHERFLGIVDPDDRVAFKLRSKHISTHKMHYGAYVV